ncbi:hypothetical protein LAV72_14800 [Lysinibacillus xylanilyticus]|uniref:hypothetical protein n=1 Tax=Lysinibacillus xylanilyticus TaxID=582475 RepID=UPI002B248C00|nr:hypothetical protein [Lysinibacillus xylanilyticus]MEB2300886.1 hypothetical protein [Lysinibacillus xylanilyticus]
MKLKKMFFILLVSASLMTVSQSAFAEVGWGDTQGTAEMIPPGYGYGSTIEGAFDSEWTYYYNDTGKSLVLRPILQSPSGLNYDFFYLTYKADGEQDMLMLASDNGAGETDQIDLILRPGEKVYFNVIGHDSTQNDPTARYSFDLKLIYSE